MAVPKAEFQVALIGFRIAPENVQPELYTLLLSDGEDQPVLIDGEIAMFGKPSLASKAMELAGIDDARLGPPPREPDLVCDLAETLYLIHSEDVDQSASILNVLNTLLDLVAATRIPIPPESRRILHALADHLTFAREFGEFIDQDSITRSAVKDALLWCVGAVVAKARILK